MQNQLSCLPLWRTCDFQYQASHVSHGEKGPIFSFSFSFSHEDGLLQFRSWSVASMSANATNRIYAASSACTARIDREVIRNIVFEADLVGITSCTEDCTPEAAASARSSCHTLWRSQLTSFYIRKSFGKVNTYCGNAEEDIGQSNAAFGG